MVCILILSIFFSFIKKFIGSYLLNPKKAIAPHSSTLAWKIPWTEEPGGLQSMGSRRVRHDWATSLSLFTFMHWRRKWQPTPVFLPGESQGRESLVGCLLWGCTVGHDWSDLAAVAATRYTHITFQLDEETGTQKMEKTCSSRWQNHCRHWFRALFTPSHQTEGPAIRRSQV